VFKENSVRENQIVWLLPVEERLPEKLGRDVRPASQKPYPIFDQNLRFSLLYLWTDQKFDALAMTWLLDD